MSYIEYANNFFLPSPAVGYKLSSLSCLMYGMMFEYKPFTAISDFIETDIPSSWNFLYSGVSLSSNSFIPDREAIWPFKSSTVF